MQSRLRGCALSLPGVTEKVILDRICFQVRGKTFATEGWPEEGWAVVKMTLQDQKRLSASLAIRPEADRGHTGVTLVRLQAVDDDLLSEVMTAAWSLVHGETRAAARLGAPDSVDRGAAEAVEAASPGRDQPRPGEERGQQAEGQSMITDRWMVTVAVSV